MNTLTVQLSTVYRKWTPSPILTPEIDPWVQSRWWSNSDATVAGGGTLASQFTRMYGVFLGVGCNYKLNDQPVHEWVMASV